MVRVYNRVTKLARHISVLGIGKMLAAMQEAPHVAPISSVSLVCRYIQKLAISLDGGGGAGRDFAMHVRFKLPLRLGSFELRAQWTRYDEFEFCCVPKSANGRDGPLRLASVAKFRAELHLALHAATATAPTRPPTDPRINVRARLDAAEADAEASSCCNGSKSCGVICSWQLAPRLEGNLAYSRVAWHRRHGSLSFRVDS